MLFNNFISIGIIIGGNCNLSRGRGLVSSIVVYAVLTTCYAIIIIHF